MEDIPLCLKNIYIKTERLFICRTGSRTDLRALSKYQDQNLSFNRNQSRVVTGLLTGHNTLRRHLYLLGLLDSPLYRKCGAKEKPRPTFSVNVRPWPHSDTGTWDPSSWNQMLRV